MLVRSAGRLVLADPSQLGCDICPPNPFAVLPNANVFEAVDGVASLAIATFAAMVGVVAVRRLMRAGPLVRRLRWPVLVAGVVAMGATAFDAFEYAWNDLTHAPLVELSEPLASLLPWTVFAGRTLVPVGFLVGTLRARSAPGPLGQLTATLDAGVMPVGEAIRRALRDPSAILLRRGSEDGWAGEDGSSAGEPWPTEGRASTPIGPESAPIAAIVHDAALLDQPELLHGVVGIVRLALENERLHFQLRDQLRDVNESRERIVAAGEEERRRLERDLHDGAQQRLIGLTLALQRARSTAATESVSARLRSQLDAAAQQTAEAIRELRELARGIHPAILEDSGLEAAIGGLARRATIPVELRLHLDGRLPRVVESTAYFTIAEGLTNAQRHARATHASVRLLQRDGLLEIGVDDDGAGGADPDRGTGLRGLGDRIQALGGTFDVASAPGRGTKLRATLPVS